MKKLALLAALTALVATFAVYNVVTTNARANAPLADCDDWVNGISDRVSEARQMIKPPDRSGYRSPGAQQDAQTLYQIAQEISDSDPPEGGERLQGDLIEALSAAVAGFSGGGGAAPETQLTFAKAIIYNADIRLAILSDTC